jgi:glycosyltransferase involved in cell wall biosynthesis
MNAALTERPAPASAGAIPAIPSRRPAVVAFAKFLAYDLGGAERSTVALLREAAAEGRDVRIVSARAATLGGRDLQRLSMPDAWPVRWLDGMRQWRRFPFGEYVANRERLLRAFEGTASDAELWTYGTWAPAAALGFPGTVRFFLRSESDLGLCDNYHHGMRRLAATAYLGVERVAAHRYRSDLARVFARARVVANSGFMAERLRAMYGADAEVRYPDIDMEPIRVRLAQATPTRGPGRVVFVGDDERKGLHIVRELAARMPELPFRIVSRRVTEDRVEGNVEWLRWSADASRIYRDARLVLVPSQWAEAFGRVAREAVLLGLPVLVSDVGGLPEAVDHAAERLVPEFRRADAWEAAVRALLRSCT